jgi:DNA-binding XRE family transcriptional regulator
MAHQKLRNYVRMHRKKAGLSQRELGLLVGYNDQGQVSRHERSQTAPPLVAALGYVAVFRVPVSELFPELHGTVSREVETKLAEMEAALKRSDARGREANEIARRLIWLMERRNL